MQEACFCRFSAENLRLSQQFLAARPALRMSIKLCHDGKWNRKQWAWQKWLCRSLGLPDGFLQIAFGTQITWGWRKESFNVWCRYFWQEYWSYANQSCFLAVAALLRNFLVIYGSSNKLCIRENLEKRTTHCQIFVHSIHLIGWIFLLLWCTLMVGSSSKKLRSSLKLDRKSSFTWSL